MPVLVESWLQLPAQESSDDKMLRKNCENRETKDHQKCGLEIFQAMACDNIKESHAWDQENHL